MEANILGSCISDVYSYQDAYQKLSNICLGNKSYYITVNNVHTVIEGIINNNYREIVNNAFLAIPDGKPLSILGKIKGCNIPRIFGPTFMEKTIEWGKQKK